LGFRKTTEQFAIKRRLEELAKREKILQFFAKCKDNFRKEKIFKIISKKVTLKRLKNCEQKGNKETFLSNYKINSYSKYL
jgi:hypothetical protein